MYDIHTESRVSATCAKIFALANAQHSEDHFFSLDAADWWQMLPADVIPMTGGIHSDDSWANAKRSREKLVEGKKLHDVSMSEVSSEPGTFSAVLEVREYDCGEIRNRFEMKATMLANFDGDGIAELLVEGFRLDRSDTCGPGTGNALGAGFSLLLKKVGPELPISVIDFPNTK